MNEERRLSQAGLNTFLAKMYAFMGAAVGVSAVVAFILNNYYQYEMLTFFATHRWVMWALFIVQLAIAWTTSLRIDRTPAMTAVGLFGFAAIEGIFFASILTLYTGQDITMAFVAAAADFIVLALFGLNTKKSLAGVGRQAMAALIALIIVSVINLFLQSTMIVFVFSIIGVVIFSLLTAWDSQRMKVLYMTNAGQVNITNLALIGAFQLYLDFINLFLQLLQIFGMGGDRK